MKLALIVVIALSLLLISACSVNVSDNTKDATNPAATVASGAAPQSSPSQGSDSDIPPDIVSENPDQGSLNDVDVDTSEI